MRMLHNIKSVLAALLIVSGLFLSSCDKDAGEGGTSTIKGKVMVYDYDASFQACQDTYPAFKEDVYIIYGDDRSTYDDKMETSYDGSFEFKYLRKGKYKIFAYTKDTTGASNGTYNDSRPKLPSMVEVEITSNRSEVFAKDIIMLDNNQ